MKLKDRVKTYSFWVSLASAVILIIKLIAQKYGLNIDETFISDLVTTICGLLVILGIIVIPKTDVKQSNINVSTLTDSIVSEDDNIDDTSSITQNDILKVEDFNQKENLESTSTTQNDIVINNKNECDEHILNETQENTSVIYQNNDLSGEQNLILSIKKHINELLLNEKNNYSNCLKEYKEIFIEEINKLDE